jgi:hypothetical protein
MRRVTKTIKYVSNTRLFRHDGRLRILTFDEELIGLAIPSLSIESDGINMEFLELRHWIVTRYHQTWDRILKMGKQRANS